MERWLLPQGILHRASRGGVGGFCHLHAERNESYSFSFFHLIETRKGCPYSESGPKGFCFLSRPLISQLCLFLLLSLHSKRVVCSRSTVAPLLIYEWDLGEASQNNTKMNLFLEKSQLQILYFYIRSCFSICFCFSMRFKNIFNLKKHQIFLMLFNNIDMLILKINKNYFNITRITITNTQLIKQYSKSSCFW